MTGARQVRIGAVLDEHLLAPALAGTSPISLPAVESLSLAFWKTVGDADFLSMADALHGRFGLSPTCLSVFGNPLASDGEAGLLVEDIASLIDVAPRLGCRLVSTFAGRVPGASVPDSLPRFREVFGPLCDRAASRGVSIAFENCRFGDTWKTGRWNIAMNPDAWELIFDALPGAPIGLEWEPAHQILALADPLVQLRAWLPRILHIHGKDAHVNRDAIALRGIVGIGKIGEERLPCDGDADWADLFAALGAAGWSGAVDVEIGATPGWTGNRALEGMRRALAGLVAARSAGSSHPAPLDAGRP
ncbi:MAG: sugar phosphate isomerase/epimerase [Treponema sp.]|nr:sugar phosphate isomerase/epimerase [Treponema sp.]